MTSSGMKRGLAATAVSALAVTGLPFLTAPAHAQPLNAQAGGADQVVLYSQFNAGNEASLKDDGTNSTISLVAGGGTGVASVAFSYSLDGTTWTPIGVAATRGADGAFQMEWNGAGVVGGTVTLRAQGLSTAAAVLDTATQAGVEVLGGGAAANSVNLDNTTDADADTDPIEDGNLGVFQQPYTAAGRTSNLSIVSGTTSATSGTVALSTRSGGATGTTDAAVTAGVSGADNTFGGILNLNGYPFSAGNNNQIAIGAERDTDDVEDYTLYRQVITTVTTSGSTTAPAGGTAPITVTVTDQDGKPIAGAQVYDDADDSLVGYTDIKGQVVDNAAEGSHQYYANADNSPTYSDGAGDKAAAAVTVTAYSPVATSTEAKSTDGAAFDKDEYSAGDTYVMVEDQAGRALEGATVEYYWEFTANDGTPTAKRIPAGTAWSSATSGADGKATVAFPTTETETGDYTLHHRVPADPNTGTGGVAEKSDLTVEAGDAELVIVGDSDMETSAAAGSSVDVTYELRLVGGSVLPNRNVGVTFERGTEKAPADGVEDAGIVDTTDSSIVLSESYTTNSSGQFVVTVKDKAETDPTKQGSELGGNLDAATTNTPDIGNAQESLNNYVVDFTSVNSVGTVTLTDPVYADEEGVATPGRPVEYTVEVKNDAGDAMANQEVAVDFDHGALLAHVDGTPVNEGTVYGDFQEAANQTTVTTDSTGKAVFLLGVERDAGFDDDGRVTANVSVSLADASDSDVETFYSGTDAPAFDPATGQEVSNDPAVDGDEGVEPVNPGAVDITRAASQESSVLPNAAVGKTVYFDLVTTDMFGNRVKQDVNVTDGSSPAAVTPEMSQWVGEAPAVEATSAQATAQTLFANWTADTTSATGVHDSTLLTDSTAAINWYVVDFDRSTFTLNQVGAQVVPTGTLVTERLRAVDQKGEPIPGLEVSFFRSGPGDDQEQRVWASTNRNGVARFNFTSTKPGLATVNAAVSNDADQATVTDTVRFKRYISAGLDLGNQRDGDDVARVNAPSAARGATVKLFKVRADGSRKLVATKRANSDGNAKFVRNDTNRRGYTKYQAKVGGTMLTFADWTPKKRVR